MDRSSQWDLPIDKSLLIMPYLCRVLMVPTRWIAVTLAVHSLAVFHRRAVRGHLPGRQFRGKGLEP
jgi:hypothetical protein